MRIQVHSAYPGADTGYGTHTRHLVSRLRHDHDVFIHNVGGNAQAMGTNWDGIDIVPSGGGKHGEKSIPYWFDEHDADLVFSHHDHWSSPAVYSGIQQRGIPMVMYTVLDHDLPGKRAPEAVVQANENALRTVVHSKWAKTRMENSRVPDRKVYQIPHAFDTTKYGPVTSRIPKAELKKDMGIPEDAFLFGMVAANYGPRKNIPGHMEAFRRFRDEYDADDAYFYIHTHPTMSGGYNLYDVRDALNLSTDRVMFPDAHKMYHGFDDLTVVQLYNTFDVYLNCSQSESWGMTVTEAMATENGVIATNNSAMTEQFGVSPDYYVPEDEKFHVLDHGVLIHRGNEMWTQNATARRFLPEVEDLVEAMGWYYENQSAIDKHGKKAREYVCDNYEWDDVYENQWKPFFESVEEELSDDGYGKWYFKRREAETQGQAFQNEAQQILFEIRGETVLDVGCGTGTLCDFLGEYEYETVGVEKAEAGVEMAEEKGVEVYQGDVTDLQFKDDAYDTTIAQHVLEHVEPDVKALSELARVASEKVICIVPLRDGLEDSPDETEVRVYDEEELDRLADQFEEYAGHEMEYETFRVTEESKNWMITVEV